MEIIVGENAGFCYGVKSAVLGAKEKLKENNSIYCLGEIVHNGEVVRKLEDNGLKVIDRIEDAHDKVIIRAHGIAKEVYEKAKELNIEIFDYTCPNVLRIHKLVDEYKNKGYYIFLVGVKTHPETIGTISFCGDNSSLIETREDLEEAILKFNNSNINKLLIAVQTTFNLEKFNIYVKSINDQINDDKIEIKVENTICNATRIRQQEAKEISQNVQYMIIIGGKNSSNTKKLYEISKENCSNTVMIENKNELNIEELKGFNKIGIMAGASTPKESIDELISYLKNYK